MRFAALWAESADQTLSHDGSHRAGDQEALDTNICETGNCARRVVRVQRGEYKVTRETGVDGDAGREEFTGPGAARRLVGQCRACVP